MATAKVTYVPAVLVKVIEHYREVGVSQGELLTQLAAFGELAAARALAARRNAQEKEPVELPRMVTADEAYEEAAGRG